MDFSIPTNSVLETTKNGIHLRILTFNLFYGGDKVENGIEKIAKHIKAINPDIAALQEVPSLDHYEKIMNALGPEWNGATTNLDYCNNAIVTKHNIDRNSITFTSRGATFGANIILATSNKTISFWSVHLHHRPYGPYSAPNATNLEQIIFGDFQIHPAGRVQDIMEMMNQTIFQNALKPNSNIPLIVVGDFNTPSHLDWIEETKDLHHNWTISWPVTNILQSVTGLKDSFREVFPNPRKYPGNTWTTINPLQPQDRIDFIMYKSSQLIPYFSYIYSGTKPLNQIPNNITLNDYPSDHYAVVTNFYYMFE